MVQRNSDARQQMLAERRAAQRSRVRGFTPVPNKRVNAMMQERFAVLLAAETARRTEAALPLDAIDTAELQREAVTDVARKLPSRGFELSTLWHRKPSRSDSVKYRGIGGAGPARQKALAS